MHFVPALFHLWMDNYRAVMEVLTWLEPPDLLKSTVKVNTRWLEVSNSREIWQSLLPPDIDVGSLTPKEYYSQYLTKHIYVVLNTHIKEFNVKLKTWRDTPLSHPIKINYEASIVPVLPHTVLVCGTLSKPKNTFLVDTKTGNVTDLDVLNPGRQGMGIISIQKTVYAFCGENTLQCNKISLTKGKTWLKFGPATHPRSFFNPCFYHKKVYLLGGKQANGESYDLSTSKFTSLSLKFPDELCVTIIRSTGTVIAICEDRYMKRKLLSNKAIEWKSVQPNLWPYCFTGHPVVLVGNTGYFLLRSRGEVIEMDLKSFTWQGYSYDHEVKPRMKR